MRTFLALMGEPGVHRSAQNPENGHYAAREWPHSLPVFCPLIRLPCLKKSETSGLRTGNPDFYRGRGSMRKVNTHKHLVLLVFPDGVSV